MNAKTETPDEPSVVGVRVRPVWSLVLYALLVLSAGAAFYAQRSPGVDPVLARVTPLLFLVFVFGFSFYRIALVAARRYSPFKAFIQIFLASLFFLLLLFPRAEVSLDSGSLLNHPEARVRAQAAELSGLKGEVSQAAGLVKLLSDPSPAVKASAHEALVRLNGGSDLGPSPDAWRKRFP